MENRFSLHRVNESNFIFDIEAVNLYKIDYSLYQLLKQNKKDIYKYIPDFKQINTLTSTNEIPISNIHINVAQVCNLSCIYCYGIDGEYGMKGKMEEKLGCEIIDYLIEKSLSEKELTIVFFGGEPLLNFDLIVKIVSYCESKENLLDKKFLYSIVTNGTKFNAKINAFLNEKRFNVTVSLDGDKVSHNKNRPFRNGKGSYDNILPKVISFLKTRNGNATVRATLTSNTSNISDFNTHLKQIGFRNILLEVATISEYNYENNQVTLLNKEQYNQLEIIDENIANEFLKAVKKRENLQGLKNSYIYIYYKQLSSKSRKKQFCGVSRDMRGISANGELYPCHRFIGDKEFLLGNINNSEDVEQVTNINFINNHPICSKCFARYFCGGGGCIHNNYIKNGNIQKLDNIHCEKIKRRTLLSFKLYHELNEEDKLFISK